MWLVLGVSVLLLSMFVLGSFVLLRGAKSAVNYSFAAMAYAMVLWILCNFVGANFKDSSISLLATKLDFITGCVMAYTVWVFSASLLAKADTRKAFLALYSLRTKIMLACLAGVAAAATLVSSVIKVVKPADKELQVTYGEHYFIFAIGLAIIVGGIVVCLYLAYRLAKDRLRQQISLMLAALVFTAFFVGFVNLALPQISTSDNINLLAGNLSYIGIGFFVASIFYSIIKHRLFDLRLVIARSAAYLLLIAVLTVGYVSLAILISNTLVTDFELTGRQLIVPIVAIVLLTFTINPLVRFFNKLTNRVFYKDSYEPQQFLGTLNQTVISNVDMDALLQGVTNTMEQYLKVHFAVFDLRKTKYADGRVVGTSGFELDTKKASHWRTALSAHNNHIIITDELSQDQDTLHRLLDGQNVAASVRLSTSHGQELGFLLLGHKKNGGPYTSQDIEMLDIASGELVIAIQNALRFEEIENFNITLQERVAEATRKLRHTNDKLRMLDETKDDFISMASHQLRTPLTSVKGYVSMVLDGDAGRISPLQRKLLNQAFISSQRMVYLISDLLNVSRLRTGKFVIEPIPTNLAAVVKDEVVQLQETAKGRNLTLTYERPEHFPVIMLDETKLRQVIMNFIDNAIYYTPSGGHITVQLTDKPQSIEFTVIDDGIGVPKHEQHHLFTKFYRAHNAKRARPDGTGLGLFMAKKVVVAQGGAVIFKSQEDKGSTFGFSFAKEKLDVVPEKAKS